MTLVEATHEGRVGWITFNRSEKLNALNPKAFEEFSDGLVAQEGFSVFLMDRRP